MTRPNLTYAAHSSDGGTQVNMPVWPFLNAAREGAAYQDDGITDSVLLWSLG